MAEVRRPCTADDDAIAWFSPVCPVVQLLGRYHKLRDQHVALGTTAASDAVGYEIAEMECEIAALQAQSTAGLMMQARIAQRVAESLDNETAARLLRTFAVYAERSAALGVN